MSGFINDTERSFTNFITHLISIQNAIVHPIDTIAIRCFWWYLYHTGMFYTVILGYVGVVVVGTTRQCAGQIPIDASRYITLLLRMTRPGYTGHRRSWWIVNRVFVDEHRWHRQLDIFKIILAVIKMST